MGGRVLVTGGAALDSNELDRLSEAGLEIVPRNLDSSEPAQVLEALKGVGYYLYGGIEPADLIGRKDFSADPEAAPDPTQFQSAHAAGLQLIAFAGKGVRGFLNVPQAKAARIVVTNTPGAVEISVVEFTAHLIFELLRDVDARARAWEAHVMQGSDEVEKFAKGTDIRDARIRIIGLGDIGAMLARLLVTGYGARVSYWSRNRKVDLEHELGLEYVELGQALDGADVVSFHLDDTPETRDIVANLPLETATPGIKIINTAKPGLIGPERLYTLLTDGPVKRAAIDEGYDPDGEGAVLAPLGPDRLYVTHHAANATEGSWIRMTRQAVDSIIAHANGKKVPGEV